jgi:hypothetical protein
MLCRSSLGEAVHRAAAQSGSCLVLDIHLAGPVPGNTVLCMSAKPAPPAHLRSAASLSCTAVPVHKPWRPARRRLLVVAPTCSRRQRHLQHAGGPRLSLPSALLLPLVRPPWLACQHLLESWKAAVGLQVYVYFVAGLPASACKDAVRVGCAAAGAFRGGPAIIWVHASMKQLLCGCGCARRGRPVGFWSRLQVCFAAQLEGGQHGVSVRAFVVAESAACQRYVLLCCKRGASVRVRAMAGLSGYVCMPASESGAAAGAPSRVSRQSLRQDWAASPHTCSQSGHRSTHPRAQCTDCGAA